MTSNSSATTAVATVRPRTITVKRTVALEVRPNDRMRFTPDEAAVDPIYTGFHDFAARYRGQECVVDELSARVCGRVTGEDAEDELFDTLERAEDADPAISVRFTDGMVRAIRWRHLTPIDIRPAPSQN